MMNTSILYPGCKVRTTKGPSASDRSKYYIVAAIADTLIVAYSPSVAHGISAVSSDWKTEQALHKFIEVYGKHSFWCHDISEVQSFKGYVSKTPKGKL